MPFCPKKNSAKTARHDAELNAETLFFYISKSSQTQVKFASSFLPTDAKISSAKRKKQIVFAAKNQRKTNTAKTAKTRFAAIWIWRKTAGRKRNFYPKKSWRLQQWFYPTFRRLLSLFVTYLPRMKPIAVAILNWACIYLLKRFLPLVIEHSSALASIYVIDNGSTDDSVNWVKRHVSEVKTLFWVPILAMPVATTKLFRALPRSWLCYWIRILKPPKTGCKIH